MPGTGRHAPRWLVMHVIKRVVDPCEVLLPKRLHAPDSPRVVCVRKVDGVKVNHVARAFVRPLPLGLGNKP